MTSTSPACPFCTMQGKTLTGEVADASMVLYGKLDKADEKAETTDIEIETIIKDKNLPSELKYYNSEGKLVKTETRTGYTCGDGDKKNICTPATLKMVDHTKNLTTTMTRKAWLNART